MKLFLDLNSVLSDFDGHYLKTVGSLPPNWRDHTPSNIKQASSYAQSPAIDWLKINHRRFYETMPPMPDMKVLWDYVKHFNPTILSGVPGLNRHQEHEDTVRWVQRNLDKDVYVITCASRDKHKYGGPGTLLIDDWERYKHLWVGAGGAWITHVSAEETIQQLRELDLCPIWS